jgi:hypothetical protein
MPVANGAMMMAGPPPPAYRQVVPNSGYMAPPPIYSDSGDQYRQMRGMCVQHNSFTVQRDRQTSTVLHRRCK